MVVSLGSHLFFKALNPLVSNVLAFLVRTSLVRFRKPLSSHTFWWLSYILLEFFPQSFLQVTLVLAGFVCFEHFRGSRMLSWISQAVVARICSCGSRTPTCIARSRHSPVSVVLFPYFSVSIMSPLPHAFVCGQGRGSLIV
jgi:hypothetical protein